MASLTDFILQQVFPALGVLTGTFMSFAPFRAVLKASSEGTLGDLNPTPWVFMLGNCCGWLTYAYLTENVFIFLPNAPGFILAIWLNIQAIKLQYENHRSCELQNAIIAALEELDAAKSKKGKEIVKREEVTQIVEHVIIDEEPPVLMIDPITTMPQFDEAEGGGEGGQRGHHRRSSSMSNALRSPKYTRSSKNYYHSTLVVLPGSSIDPETPIEDHDNFAITSVQEATERIVDYGSFIWDIAAQRTPAPASHELLVVAISVFWLMLISLVVFSQSVWSEATRILIIGISVNANLIFFYGAPLSKIATVLETRSSKTIHIPTMICSLANGTLWFVYGVAVKDFFVAVPNGVGAALGVVQFLLCIFFPRHHHSMVSYDYDKYQTGTIEDGNSITKTESSQSLSLPEESTPLI
jgi:uncharacterized protein with PQ loop repeat